MGKIRNIFRYRKLKKSYKKLGTWEAVYRRAYMKELKEGE